MGLSTEWLPSASQNSTDNTLPLLPLRLCQLTASVWNLSADMSDLRIAVDVLHHWKRTASLGLDHQQ